MSLKPTQNVGVQAEINIINNAKLASFGNDPGKMLDEMEMKFNHIQDVLQESVFMTKQFTIQVFRSLLTLTNQDFIQYTKGKKDLFNEGRDVDVFDVINS
eukprot:15173175-Ditylum_brightwellii.AAC.1